MDLKKTQIQNFLNYKLISYLLDTIQFAINNRIFVIKLYEPTNSGILNIRYKNFSFTVALKESDQ